MDDLSPEWRLAIQMLLDAAENCGPMLFARIGIERGVERSYGISSSTGVTHLAGGLVTAEESMSDDPDFPKANHALQVLRQLSHRREVRRHR